MHTDNCNLKFLLDQRLLMIPQHQWVSKLFSYNFTIEYHPSYLNTVVNAPSHRDAEHATAYALSGPSFSLFDDLRQ